MFATLGNRNNSNALFYKRAIPLQKQLENLQKTVGILLKQSQPFSIVSFAWGRCEARGEVVARLHYLYCFFLLVRNQLKTY